MTPTITSGEPRFWAAITDEQRTVYAAVALDGSGVWEPQNPKTPATTTHNYKVIKFIELQTF